MKPHIKAFVAGCLFHSAFMSILQDFVGRDAYIRHLQEGGWWPWYVTVPIALTFIVVSCVLLRMARQDWDWPWKQIERPPAGPFRFKFSDLINIVLIIAAVAVIIWRSSHPQ